MAAFKCGNCSENSHFTPSGIGEAVKINVNGNKRILCQQALRCDMCKRLTIAYKVEYSYPQEADKNYGWSLFWDRVGEPDAYYPRPTNVQEYPNVPPSIATAATEAYEVHNIKAYRATAILCRAVIEAVCKDQKAVGNNLFKKIDNLYDRGLVRLFVKETAHVLRAIGNDMAHGDFEQEFTSDDADHILGFMDSILDELYESTAKLTKMQDLIASRKELLEGSQ